MLPTVLTSGEVAYLRYDKTANGVFYGSGKPGPKGDDLRGPSWSPDGKQVVFSRFVFKRPTEPVKQLSKNPEFDLYATAWLPEYDPTGEHLAVTKIKPGGEG